MSKSYLIKIILWYSPLFLLGCAHGSTGDLLFGSRDPLKRSIDHEYKDKGDLVIDRENAYEQGRRGSISLQFKPVDIAKSVSDKSQREQINKEAQDFVSLSCMLMSGQVVLVRNGAPVRAVGNYQQTVDQIRSGQIHIARGGKATVIPESLLIGGIQERYRKLDQISSNLGQMFANVSRSTGGETLLMCASKSNAVKIADFLLHELKVDKSLANYYDETAESMANSRGHREVQRVLASQSAAEPSQSLLNVYCNGNRPVRFLKETLTATLPDTPKGLPVDGAQGILVGAKSKARQFAREFFVWERPKDSARRRFLGLKDDKFIPRRGSDELYGFGLVNYSIGGKEIGTKLSDVKSWESLDQLRHEFTFNMPQEVQQKFFEVKALTDPYTVHPNCNGGSDFQGNFHDGGGYLALDKDCKFSSGQALVDRARAWKNYAHRFTVVKEAPIGSDKIRFEITLDMTAFCAYGVAVSDLVSQ